MRGRWGTWGGYALSGVREFPPGTRDWKPGFWGEGRGAAAYREGNSLSGEREFPSRSLQRKPLFGGEGLLTGTYMYAWGGGAASKARSARICAFGGSRIGSGGSFVLAQQAQKKPGLSTGLKIFWIFNYSMMSTTTPEPTVRPPSRIAKRRPFSIAMGVISVHSMSMWSPGMTISTPSGSLMLPVTSVVRK